MCGLAGLRSSETNKEQRVSLMLSSLAHRGPDGNGIWSASNLVLGHCRLAINDLSEAGSQPMVDPFGSVVICVNGEIYNYRQLRGELESLGHKFLSNSDSEVVIYAWKQWKEHCFDKFNGMFAISIYDLQSDLLYLVRDRLGIKPLYYKREINRAFVFASEIKAIRVGASYDSGIDIKGLAQYFTYQNYFSNNTLNNNIKSVEPGSYIVVDRLGQVSTYKYAKNLIEHSPQISFEEAVEEYRTVLDNSIERHLMSDVPIASYLSAGFDSSTIANRASHFATPPVCYTGRFPESGWYDEASFAKLQAQANGSEHIAVDITYRDLPRVLDRLVWHLDDPIMGMGSFSQYCVAEKVAEKHKVILTGHGGDELFSGYPVFKLAHILDNISISSLNKLGIRASELPHLVFYIIQQLKSNTFKQFFPVLNDKNTLNRALKSEYRIDLSKVKEDDWSDEHNSYQEKLYYNYLNHYLQGLLVVEDKISMAHSLESRTPFLDNEFLELSLKVPWEVKLREGKLKSIIKQGGIGRLLPDLYDQPKKGFPTPLRLWLRGPLQGWFKEKIVGDDSRLRVLFDDKWLKSTYHSYMSSPRQYLRPLDEVQSHRMWQLLCLESWLRNNE